MAKAVKRSRPTRSYKSKAYVDNWNNTDLADYIQDHTVDEDHPSGIVLVPRDMKVLQDAIFGTICTVFNREQIIKKAQELHAAANTLS